jgi:hypothetical protein
MRIWYVCDLGGRYTGQPKKTHRGDHGLGRTMCYVSSACAGVFAYSPLVRGQEGKAKDGECSIICASVGHNMNDS